MQWPFKDMEVGQKGILWDVNPAQAAMTAHNTGRYKGWKFKTEKVVTPEGRVGLKVERLPDPERPWVTDSDIKRGPRLTLFGYEHLAVGEEVRLTGEPEWIAKALAGVQARERSFKIKLKRKTEKHPIHGTYVALRVKRIA